MSVIPTFAVYTPPSEGLPFLAVMVLHNGEVVAMPYDSAEGARAHNASAEESIAEQIANMG